MFFEYGEKETMYLAAKDKKLGEAMARIGHVYRSVDDDLFAAVVHQIMGQQISTAALETLWGRLNDRLHKIDAEGILFLGREGIKEVGMSFRKAEYILDFAEKVKSGEFDISALEGMADDKVIAALSSLKGVGVWTAEMILIFCMQRKDVVSFGDLAILRGMRMLYRHREIDKAKFEKYRKRYSPYGSVASLYLWEISGGALEGVTDPAVRGGKEKR